MASGVGLSHVRGLGHPLVPPESVSYVRMVLLIERVEGTIFTEACSYFFQWMRAGKIVKVTAALKLTEGPAFGQKMAIYVQVRRHGPVFVPEDASEPLNTSLVLMAAMPRDGTKVVSTISFDIAHYLAVIVDAGTKSLCTSLHMPSSITLAVKIAVKVIGENHLRPYVSPDQDSRIFEKDVASDMDEAEAAQEIERLRQNVREKEHRLTALEESTSRLDQNLQLCIPQEVTGLVPDVSSLKVHIQELEKERDIAIDERLEAERKIASHIVHAAKIKDTYNQLAAWYNSLCKDHEDLQKRHASLSSGSTHDHPMTVSTIREVDFIAIQKERDELQALLDLERSEKRETFVQSTELLENNSHAYDVLREECNGAQSELVLSRRESEQQAVAISDLQNTVNSLISTLNEKYAFFVQNSSVLCSSQMNSHKGKVCNVECCIRKGNGSEKESGSLQLHSEGGMKPCLSLSNRLFVDSASITEPLKENTLESVAVVEERTANHEYCKGPHIEVSFQMLGQKEDSLESNVSLEMKTIEEDQATLRSNNCTRDRCSVRLSRNLLKDDRDSLVREEKLSPEVQFIKDGLKSDTQVNPDDDVSKLSGSARAKCIDSKMVIAEQDLLSCSMPGNALDANLNRKVNHCEEQKYPYCPQEFVALVKKEVLDSNVLQSGLKQPDKRNLFSLCATDITVEENNLPGTISQLDSERNCALLCYKNKNPVLDTSQDHMVSNEEIHRVSEERDRAILELFKVRKVLKSEIGMLKVDKEELMGQLRGDVRCNQHKTVVGQMENFQDVPNPRDEHCSTVEIRRMKQNSRRMASDNLMSKIPGTLEILETPGISEKELDQVRSSPDDVLSSVTETREQYLTHSGEEKESIVESEMYDMQQTVTESKLKMQSMEQKMLQLTESYEAINQQLINVTNARDEIYLHCKEEQDRAVGLQAEIECLKKALDLASSSKSLAQTVLVEVQTEVSEREATIAVLQSQKEACIKAGKEKETIYDSKISYLEAKIMTLSSSLVDEKASVKGLQGAILTKNSELDRLNVALVQANTEKSNMFVSMQDLEAENAQLVRDIEEEASRTKEALKETFVMEGKLRCTMSAYLKMKKESMHFNDSGKELEQIKKTHSVMESELQEALQNNINLSKVSHELENKVKGLNSSLEKLAVAKEQSVEEYNNLLETHRNVKQTLRDATLEQSEMKSEWCSLSELVPKLQREMDTLRENMRSMKKEYNSVLSKERAKVEEEAQRAEDLQTHLDNSQALIASLRDKIESLSAEKDVRKQKRDSADQELLKSLIDTRLQLAYAQEETVRLRNMLTKIAHNGTERKSEE